MDETVPNGKYFYSERFQKAMEQGVKTGQTILSLLVVAWFVQWHLFSDKVRPVHLPPKKEEGTALPPVEPDRPFPVG